MSRESEAALKAEAALANFAAEAQLTGHDRDRIEGALAVVRNRTSDWGRR